MVKDYHPIERALDSIGIIVWLSCVEKGMYLSDIISRWVLQRHDEAIYKAVRKLEDLSLLDIELRRRTGASKEYKFCKAKTDWIPDYFRWASDGKIDSSFLVKIVGSLVFREICMELNSLVDEIHRRTQFEDQIRRQTIRHPSTPLEISKIMQDFMKKKEWKKIDWKLMILGRVHLLHLFKSFDEDEKNINLFMKEPLHVHESSLVDAFMDKDGVL